MGDVHSTKRLNNYREFPPPPERFSRHPKGATRISLTAENEPNCVEEVLVWSVEVR
jgi:hypothetical protein